MGKEYLGLHAIGWHGMVKTWWDKTLAILLLTTIVLGCLYILSIIGKKLYARWKVRRPPLYLPSPIMDTNTC
jgi:hypothetical protein